MLKTFLFLFIIPFSAFSQQHKVLNQDYSFLTADIEVNKVRQSNDVLYFLKCYTDKQCRDQPVRSFKIIESVRSGDFTILKLERLDSIYLSRDPSPLTKYAVHVIKISDGRQIGYLQLKTGLTRLELDSYKTDLGSLKEMFYFTYFSDTYLKELSSLKAITTKASALGIIEHFKSDNFKSLLETYKKNQVADMYGSGLTGELLSRACIENGYNPFGAGPAIELLMKR